MPFLGQSPAEGYKSVAKQDITGTGATVYTLDHKVTTEAELEVFVNNVRQEPSTAYTVSGNQITFATAVESSDDCYIVFQGKAVTSNLIESQNIAEDMEFNGSHIKIPAGTTAQRPTSPLTGMVRMNTTVGSMEFYDGNNWIFTNLIPDINSITGTIYAGAESTLTISITNSTGIVDVKYYDGEILLATDSGVTVTGGNATSTVPAAVYGQTAGDTISIQIVNDDGTPSSNNITKTVQGLPTGGSIVTTSGYRYHTFNSSDSFTVPSGFSADINYLIVAGGGSGGSNKAGGGGAGGVISGTTTVSTQSYTVIVGAGGNAVSGTSRGNNGANSSAFSATAVGGGAGGGDLNNQGQTGSSGGSGGGGSRGGGGGSGTSGQGNNGGGSVNGAPYPGGGGGGAGSAGASGSGSSPGNGGSGTSAYSEWLNATGAGVSGVIAGGGGSVGYSLQTSNFGTGGSGGGGNGNYTQGENGVANTGSGGGGTDGATSGQGGSGIVIIRYQLT